VFHSKVSDWMKITGETDVKKSPWYNCCANDIDWENRVKLQGKIQKNICHSISSTINLPKDVSVDVVKKIYETAWENGLKGITVYRDGCRSGVLVDKSEKKDEVKINSDKRPKELECEIYYTNISKKLDKVRHFQYMVLIGMLNNRPYELFCYEDGKYDKKYSKGKIVKHNKGNYELIIEDGTSIKNVTKDTTDAEDALTRMISISLRHNIPINFIVEQLNKVEGDLFSFAKCIARSLKKFIKDGTISSENCEKCDSKLIFENGCFMCKNCGWSKC
jgi:ribonucleoside-diphosphate reductase alpha chain